MASGPEQIHLAFVVGVYVGVVVAFEALCLGWYQPELENMSIPTLVITTTDDSEESHSRRLARRDVDGKLHVSAHHWPRAWRRCAVENANAVAGIGGVESASVAVLVTGKEFERVSAGLPLRYRFGS